jgi:hypothetical protein
LRHHTGMRAGDARAAIECGEVSELLAETGEAWRAGEISTGAARFIAAARVESHDDELVACEPVLLDLARAQNLRSLRQATAHFRNLALADGTEPGEHDGLTLSQTYAGTTLLHGELSDAAAETVATALNAYTDPPSADDPRTHAQRQAAALVQICDVAIAHTDSDDRPRTHASLVVDWKTLTEGELGRSGGEFTGPIHPLDIRRLLCDSTITRIVTGPDSLPLDLGRSRRTVPPSLRKALVIRDGGCRWPGCNKPPGWCAAHHTKHWIDGGETNINTLVLFCDHHHGVAHKPGWTVTFDGHHLTIRRPDGTEVA